MVQGNRVDFTDEGVSVIVPPQNRLVKVIKLPMGPLSDYRSGQADFQPGRMVINLGVVEEAQPGVYVTEFNPRFELRVRYNRGDLERAKKAGQSLPTLAFWNGQEWIPFTKEKHQFEMKPGPNPSEGGEGVAYISNWGDPPVGWGP